MKPDKKSDKQPDKNNRSPLFSCAPYLLFAGIFALLLSGCASKQGASPAGTPDGTQPLKNYEKSVLNLELFSETGSASPAEAKPISTTFLLTGKYLYYTADAQPEETDAALVSRRIFQIPKKEGAAAKFFYECRNAYFLDYTFAAEDGQEYLYLLSYQESQENPENQNSSETPGNAASDTDSEHPYLIQKIDEAGNLVASVIPQVRTDSASKERLTNLLVDDKQSFLLWGNTSLSLFDPDGAFQKSVSCPGQSFQRGVCLSDDTAAFTYTDEDNQPNLTYFHLADGTLSSPLPVSMLGVLANGEELFLYDSGHIYTINKETKEIQTCLNLRDYNLLEKWNKALCAVEKGFAVVSYQEDTAGSVQIITLRDQAEGALSAGGENESDSSDTANQTDPSAAEKEEGRYDAQGKRIITLYTRQPELLSMGISDDMIAAFNLENSNYTLELYEGKQTIDAVFTQEEHPDLLFEFVPDMIEDYAANGYLEDLWPYIDRSETLNREELHEAICRSFETDGKLYALPRSVTLQTLLGRESQMPAQGWWSVPDFITWLKEHPETNTFWGLNSQTILNYCLRGNLEQYVDFASGTAHFAEPEFTDLLLAIHALQMTGESGIRLSVNPNGTKEYADMVYLYDSNLNYLSEISSAAFVFGENMVEMGLPNDAGTKKAILTSYNNFAIFSNSSCPEGAYEFIEFCLLYRPFVDANIIGNNANGAYWTARSVRDFDIAQTLGEHIISYQAQPGAETDEVRFTVTEEHKELFLSILEHAVIETKEQREILSIIEEETQPFFSDQMDAAAVCEKIQNRVQLLLNENR